MVEIICSRSGLKFEAENRRKRVHPGISAWTAHKDYEIRDIACKVIERGKAEAWNTLNKFEAEIQAALNVSPALPEGILLTLRQASRVGSFKKPWVALIEGPNAEYGYERKFVTAFETERGGEWKFNLTQDGVYQVCDRNSAGAERRRWFKISAGEPTELSEEEAIAEVGPPAEVVKSAHSNGLPLTNDSGSAVEQCLECGALFTEHGYVDYGGMSCRRCD